MYIGRFNHYITLFVSIVFNELLQKSIGYVITNLTYNTIERINLKKYEKNVFCFESKHSFLDYDVRNPISIFNEITFTIQENNNKPFSWHIIQGVSTDDLHQHLQSFIYQAFNLNNPKLVHVKEPYEIESFLRDIVSSCPSPIFTSNQTYCEMKFSNHGKSCVTLKADKDYKVTVLVEKKFNQSYVYNLLAGLILLTLSGTFAKSKVFQFSTGSIVFAIAGLAICLILIIQQLFSYTKFKSILRDFTIVTLCTSSYAAGIVWYLRNNWQVIILLYWEYLLGYLILSALAGLIVIRWLRSGEGVKHSLTVTVKWFIRFIGVLCFYNASSSPLYSMIIIAVIIMIYVIYAFNQWILSRFLKRKKQ